MKIIAADYIFAIGLVLMLTNYGLTSFIISQHTDTEKLKEEANNFIKRMEANPIASFIFQLEKWSFIVFGFFIPGVAVGLYWYIRTKYKDREEVVMMFSIITASIFLINFANDFGYTLGYLLR